MEETILAAVIVALFVAVIAFVQARINRKTLYDSGIKEEFFTNYGSGVSVMKVDEVKDQIEKLYQYLNLKYRGKRRCNSKVVEMEEENE